MSLGSHIIRRGRASISASGGLFSTPREPLLFLYPQWIRTAATLSQDPSVCGSQKVPSVGLDHLSSNAPILDSGFVYKNAAIKSPKYEKLLEKLGREREPALVQEALSQAGRPAHGGNDPTNDESQQLLENSGTIATNPDSEGDTGPWHSTAVIRRIKASKGHASPFRSTSVIRRILAIERRRVTRKVYNKQVRENYEEKKVSERMDGEPNWREVLHGLERHTPNGAEYWHDNVLRIRVPSKAMGRLLYSEEDNIWAIKIRCGCQIEVSEVNEESRGCRVILVSGPVHSITKAAVEILRAAPRAVSDEEIWSQQVPAFSTRPKRQRPSLSDNGSSTLIVRSIRTDARHKLRAPIRADKVPRPVIWTPESFGLYVQNLTSIRMSTHLQKILYKPGEIHTDAVVDILQALFADPECRTAISAAAFNNALAYLVKHNAIHVVRDLYVRMEMQNLRMDTETFNIMLRGTAKSRSIGNFHYILWLMLRRGYTPNADTWLAFMRAMENPQIKAHILKGMKDKELIHDPRIQKRVCESFIDMEISTSLDDHMTHEQFLAHMADRYGQDWLTKDSANRILDALGSRGLISRCWDFLELMHTKDVKLSDVSILTVLHHCEKQDNPQGAIEIIRRVSSLIGYEPSQEAYHSLFNIAWEARLHCVARVVWRYACLNAATTYVMRRRIIAGIQTAISNSSQSLELKFRSRKEWAARACRFILGVPIPLPARQRGSLPEDLGHILPPLLYRAAFQASISPSEENINLPNEDINQANEDIDPIKVDTHSGDKATRSAEPDSNTRGENNNRAAIVRALEEQAQAFHFWKPQRHFADVLAEAFETDKKWLSSGGSYEDDRLEGLYLKAPAIPLRRKTSLWQRMPWDRKVTLSGMRSLRKRVSMWKRVLPLEGYQKYSIRK
jgi:hypothetical protein